MKLDLTKVDREIEITVSGTEKWLDELYEQFPIPGGVKARPNLTASLQVTLQEPSEYVRVKGALQYEPLVDCSRCADSIPWTVNSSFDEYYRRADDPNAKETLIDTELANMEDNFLADDMLDVAGLLNEVVQLALPSKLVKASPDGTSCLICKKDISSPVIHSPSTDEELDQEESPFAVLKGLKLDS